MRNQKQVCLLLSFLVLFIAFPAAAMEQRVLEIRVAENASDQMTKFFTRADLSLILSDSGQVRGVRITTPNGRINREFSYQQLTSGADFSKMGMTILGIRAEPIPGSDEFKIRVKYLYDYGSLREKNRFRFVDAKLKRNRDGQWGFESLDPKQPGPFKVMIITAHEVNNTIKGIGDYKLMSLDPQKLLADLEPAQGSEDPRIATNELKRVLDSDESKPAVPIPGEERSAGTLQ